MADALSHRGPDDWGTWADPQAGVAMGFRRLSILDLSAAGHQPMVSASGRFVACLNGEMYNFQDVRDELLAAQPDLRFRGHSDTEVILAAVERWGLEATLRRMVGMFAIALWDRQERQLHLIRDRLGVKPLYYGWIDGTLLYGSELKALRAHPVFHASIDRGALSQFLRFSYVPAPQTIFSGIRKLMPGTFLTVRADRPGQETQTIYWDPAAAFDAGQRNPFPGSDSDAIEQTERLLRDSVRLRMIADVPVGVFLSGGLDSSTVVAMMQATSSAPVKTFTIGFREDEFNEAARAKQIAAHLGTDHTELYLSAEEALEVIPQLPRIFDEPFADSSQIPTYLVSKLARTRVTVSLSGDGGDELFGGYNRYRLGNRFWRTARVLPFMARDLSGKLLRQLVANPRTFSVVHKLATTTGMIRGQDSQLTLRKLGEVLSCREPESIYGRFASHDGSRRLVLGTNGGNGHAVPSWPHDGDFAEQMMLQDLRTYLPDDLLVKVDRASMAVSLEGREPLLDHRLVEFAFTLPLPMKIRNGEGKWILRQVLARHLPENLISGPKSGFSIPLSRWLRGPLRSWAEEQLTEKRLREEGFFDSGSVREMWQQHVSGTAEWHHQLWDVLMFQSWLESSSQPVAVPERVDDALRAVSSP